MPTPYPKCTYTELMGFLVLLNGHGGDEDIARLADDLDLEIDEIVPSAEFAEVLGLLKVADGHATLTELGRHLLAASIRDRKRLLRDQLRRTTLYRAIMRALEKAPDHQLTDEDVDRLIAFTTAPADEYVQNIINWGRLVELFRYNSTTGTLTPIGPEKTETSRPAARGGPPRGGTSHRSSGEESERVVGTPVPPAERAVSALTRPVVGSGTPSSGPTTKPRRMPKANA